MSLPEDNQQLRKLSRAVMRGELSRAEYQQKRRQMIDGYTGDTGAANDIDITNPGTRPAIAVQDATLPGQSRTVQNKAVTETFSSQGSLASAEHSDLWIGLVAVVGVILAIAAMLAYFW